MCLDVVCVEGGFFQIWSHIYSKHKGCISSYANLGNINEQLLKFEKSLNNTDTESTFTDDQTDNIAKTS